MVALWIECIAGIIRTLMTKDLRVAQATVRATRTEGLGEWCLDGGLELRVQFSWYADASVDRFRDAWQQRVSCIILCVECVLCVLSVALVSIFIGPCPMVCQVIQESQPEWCLAYHQVISMTELGIVLNLVLN